MNWIVLELHQEFGFAGFRECRLRIVVSQQTGFSRLQCVAQAGESSNQQDLTADERTELRRLVDESALWSAGHIGADPTPTDGVYETLKLTEGGRTVVRVASGNPTFGNGPRRELWMRLDSLRTELRKGLKRHEPISLLPYNAAQERSCPC